ncbi:MAG: type IIL restriction-modification enzyme MmeI [Saprospiraceae bacterium]
MPLSWNEIKTLAQAFAKEWETESSEPREAKTFWDQFFQVFGVSAAEFACFESSVKKAGSKQGFIDLFWPVRDCRTQVKRERPGLSIQQAIDYFPGIKRRRTPKYILISDFQRFAAAWMKHPTRI